MSRPTEPIPGPPPLPILGNLLDLDRSNTIKSFNDLGKKYGPLYKLRLAGSDRLFATGYEVIHELCSRKDFVKIPVGLVRSQKSLTPEGLFTADHGEECWDLAHRVLMPAFGPLSIKGMFAEMHDLVCQLALKWARFGDESPIDVAGDFTRLTLDTIALCAMGMRFNSFYKDQQHPFVDAMMSTFAESQQRSVRPSWLTSLMWRTDREFSEGKEAMYSVAAEVIARRRAKPNEKKDLLNAMLKGRDPVTGKPLSDQIITDNMITFLIAGHETTSNLLAFTFALLVLNPEIYAKVQHEVDMVLGTGSMTPDHVVQLPYIKACLKESLRLFPPAPGFSLSPEGDQPTVVGGQWLFQPDDCCVILLDGLHRDTEIYGEDANEFRPERMLDENFNKLPPHCYKPFGHGARSCIGSEFALQEAIMATAILMQKLEFSFVDPEWKMTTKQTAVLKPHNLFMHAKLRGGADVVSLQRDLFHGSGDSSSGASTLYPGEEANGDGALQPMSIFYGSNTGTCESLAERLAVFARQRGFKCTVKALNEAVDRIPIGQPVLFVSSTHYEGQPPDNAAGFIKWLDGQKEGSLDGVSYGVFGCGNREWKETFQAIPAHIYDSMQKLGAQAIAARGMADAGEGNMIGDFDTWQADHLWPGVSSIFGTQSIDMNVANGVSKLEKLPNGTVNKASSPSPTTLAVVEEVRQLTEGEDRPKYHMEAQLPEGVTYEVGDYLDVYPRNSQKDIERLVTVMKRLNHDEKSPLVSVLSLDHELNQPTSIKQLETLLGACNVPEEKDVLESISRTFAETPATRRPSVLSFLEAYPGIQVSLNQLATLLPPIRPRPYSISSTPLVSPSRCTLTWSLISRETTSPGASGQEEEAHIRGLASHHLASLKGGDSLSCAVRPGQSRFRPPTDLTTPIIMICAGAGVAPFAGFVAHRAEQLRRDPTLRLGPALLYIGCRSAKHKPYTVPDGIGSDVVDVRYAYSQPGSADEGFQGYVQDRVWAERGEFMDLWERGARVYVCGSQAISLGVKGTVRRIYGESGDGGSRADAEVDEWWVEILRERYAVDVF